MNNYLTIAFSSGERLSGKCVTREHVADSPEGAAAKVFEARHMRELTVLVVSMRPFGSRFTHAFRYKALNPAPPVYPVEPA